MKNVPHVIPYQGSKRKIAEAILSYLDFRFDTLYEPFVGSGAITLATASAGKANRFVVADKLEPLANLWKMIIDEPDLLIAQYSALWTEQLNDPVAYFNSVRDEFNKSKSPAALLYLIARCVKNAVRFNANGEFNQSADHRRLGMKPTKIQREVKLMAKLLNGKTSVLAGDFREATEAATANDVVYMDPPWQGTSGKRDSRYAFLLNMEELTDELVRLNNRSVPYLLSFDGTCGRRTYGSELPASLGLFKVDINAGRSTQATLLGRNDVTIESLYLSPALLRKTATRSHVICNFQNDLLEETSV